MASGCSGVPGQKLGIAFACVIGAALASVMGALFTIFVPIKNKLFLAAALSFAAGVMLYISVVDIYVGKGVGHFEDAGFTSAHAFTYATICFFGGFPIAYALDKLAHYVVYPGHNHASSVLPVNMVRPRAATENPQDSRTQRQTSSSLSVVSSVSNAAMDAEADKGLTAPGTTSLAMDDLSEEEVRVKARKLVHMGLLAAMAMALHNMPEGLVTFVGYMDSVYSGVTTAIAIAIHNIPEGMVIASAVYFGTGNRFKAVLWAALAALAEPMGGLIGLAVVCGGSMTDVVFGVLFGLVGGIMVYISVKELLPSAHKFDPDDRVTSGCLTAGMIIMACSLIAIAFSEPPEDLTEGAFAAVEADTEAASPPVAAGP